MTKDKGAGGQFNTHLHSVLVLDTFSKSSGRRGGQKKGRYRENALIHSLNHRPSISPPEKNTKYNNSDF